jgi:hypothetical protein
MDAMAGERAALCAVSRDLLDLRLHRWRGAASHVRLSCGVRQTTQWRGGLSAPQARERL